MTMPHEEKPWLNGSPYYCVLCGAGGNEYSGCEMPNCELETVEAAQERRRAAQMKGEGRD